MSPSICPLGYACEFGWCELTSVVSDSLRPYGLEPARLLCPWDSPGKNTGVRSYSLLQKIFPTQQLNPSPLHCRQILYRLEPSGTEDHVKNYIVFIPFYVTIYMFHCRYINVVYYNHTVPRCLWECY